MSYFKDINNKLHFIDNDSFEYLLPSGSIKITNEEAKQLINPPLTIDQQRELLQPLSAWQIRRVLTQSGLRKQVEDAVLVADQDTQDAWHYAANFRRDDAILNAMAVKLGLSDTQLDSMFELGVTL